MDDGAPFGADTTTEEFIPSNDTLFFKGVLDVCMGCKVLKGWWWPFNSWLWSIGVVIVKPASEAMYNGSGEVNRGVKPFEGLI